MEPELSKATQAMLEAAHIGPGMKVLDVACGPGHTTAAATAAGAQATGIDSSPEMIRHAAAQFPNSKFHVGDMLEPPLGPWGAILCRLGGHHADPQWISAAAKELAPGGRVAIAETDAIDDEARSKNMRSPDEWIRIMKDAGLVHVVATRSEANFDNIPRFVWFKEGGQDDDEPPKGPVYVIVGQRPHDA
jgi:SAM-dependent methyltransferase